ncbi:MAG: glycosyltransferase family 2 protein [Acidobacteria bacterium]|nr:glycosyltransferase family 2 protein [Acidobacteriota bacterium]
MAICDRFLCFVVLHYGDKNLTYKCVDSLKPNNNDLIVVANGEDEDFEKEALEKYPFVNVILIPKNLGFAGGINKGIKRAVEDGYKWIMILNNDVECLENFREKAEKIAKKCGEEKIVFSPLILDKSGEKIWFKEGKLSKITGSAKHYDSDETEELKEKKESDYLTGCAICFPSKVYEEVGLMDESYFLYWEDVDWSVRLKDGGYKLFVYPELKIKHIGSASAQLESKKYLYYYFRNHLKFIFKNYSCFILPISLSFFIFNLIRVFSAWLFFHGSEGRQKIKAVFSGIEDFLLRKEGEKVFD